MERVVRDMWWDPKRRDLHLIEENKKYKWWKPWQKKWKHVVYYNATPINWEAVSLGRKFNKAMERARVLQYDFNSFSYVEVNGQVIGRIKEWEVLSRFD